MAFISSGYNPKKPMEDRITDIGPRKYDEFYPPVIAKNKGQWQYHEVLKPGVLVHVAKSGDNMPRYCSPTCPNILPLVNLRLSASLFPTRNPSC